MTRLAVLFSVVLVASIVVLATDGAGRGGEAVAEATRIPIQTGGMTTWPTVSWTEAVTRLQECRVSEAGQTHSGDVFLTMKDGRHVRSVEPALDDLWDVFDSLPEGCGPRSMWTE
ncbi:MAG: hypothetical protein J4N71_01125 [Chloroflexi bacterium]|nr:hypothetical protein [Chloroflexota bacterium]MCI0813658.1 hypothetical protein [Chloroflexota bacterium]MCI0818974.1 hypothetical protein [Chloroflexota bacterium]MCI0883217.1 hypothetical protein [Chloroflexota bacterium]MCI0884781.1 hypothetical protein [Chloroflexota bacterium]